VSGNSSKRMTASGQHVVEGGLSGGEFDNTGSRAYPASA
jgi:hypothetical protein